MNMFGFNAGSADERSVEVAEQIDKNDRVRLAKHILLPLHRKICGVYLAVLGGLHP
jgi:hypothetical protein